MHTYRISNTTSGTTMGTYEGADESDALDTWARDAGYKSYAHLNREVPAQEGEIRVVRVDGEPDVNKPAPTKISWRRVPLTHFDGHTASEAERLECLRRYRDDNCIPDWWLATPDEVEATDDGDALADKGPRVEGIDWEGFPS